ncbi:MAG: hypothetical protein IPP19_08025 [Verrucomicrobia bacterium]|nr:hypothetical protein [Verrucomicrobiota bacterium]
MDITLSLSKNDFLTIMKAIQDRMQCLMVLQNTSTDEDQVADAGNDLIAARMLWDELVKVADARWGQAGWTVDVRPL